MAVLHFGGGNLRGERQDVQELEAVEVVVEAEEVEHQSYLERRMDYYYCYRVGSRQQQEAEEVVAQSWMGLAEVTLHVLKEFVEMGQVLLEGIGSHMMWIVD
jgi:hypothetical protein